MELLQKYQNLDPVNRQLKSWHKYKTKPTKADTTIWGNKTLLRYFRKLKNTTINENTDVLEYQTPDFKLPCLPLIIMLIAFNTSHTLHTKEHSAPQCTNLSQSILQRLYNMPNKKTLPKSKTNRRKTRF